MAGIGEPKRQELAALWSPVPDAHLKIDRIAREGPRNGLLVRKLESAGQAEAMRAAKATTPRPALPQETHFPPKRPAAHQWMPEAIEAADPDEVSKAVQRYMDSPEASKNTLPDREIRRLVANIGPVEAAKQNMLLRNAVVRTLGLHPAQKPPIAKEVTWPDSARVSAGCQRPHAGVMP